MTLGFSRFAKIGLLLLPTLAASTSMAQWYQGPSGGTGGQAFDSWQESNHAIGFSGFDVVATSSIRCLMLDYRGQTNPWAFRYGSCGRGRAEDWQTWETQPLPGGMARDEYLIGIAGTYGDHINSIRFYTNKRSWVPIKGSTSGKPFGYTAPAGQMIVAFIGRAGDNLDSIGVMYAPVPQPLEDLRAIRPKP